MSNISLFSPQFSQSDIDAVAETLTSGWVGLGPKTEEFELEFSSYLGEGTLSVALNSCTAALDLALKVLGIGPGDEVIVPAITFVSTAHAVLYNGAKVVFADVNPDSLLIDLDSAEQKTSSRTKAIIPVHYSGRCVDVSQIRERMPALKIIEDCAHACGSTFDGQKAGTFGDVACFSFHAVKNLPIGDGGMLVTKSYPLAKQARKIRWLGIDKSTWDRTEDNRSYWWDYRVDMVGQKCHMNDISAALGLSQLKRLDKGNARRREISELYSASLHKSGACLPLPDTVGSQSSWHLYPIRVHNRNALSSHLGKAGIETGVHYKPIHLYDCYGYQPPLPVAEYIWNSILSLPMHLNLSDLDVARIISAIQEGIE